MKKNIVKSSNRRNDAINAGKCSCPQSLWYLNILERVYESVTGESAKHISRMLDGMSLMDSELKDEIAQAIKFGSNKLGRK